VLTPQNRLALIQHVPNAAWMSDSDRPIVIGVDYSDHCIFAVDEALRMAASSHGASILPVLVLPGSPATGLEEATEMTSEVIDRSNDNLVQLVQARARALGLKAPPIEPRVRFGAPAEQLLAEARDFQARLIAVGTHGRRGLSHLFIGSVAEEVMRQARCSVLVARPSAANETKAASEVLPREQAPLMVAGDEGSASPAGQAEAEATIVNEPHIDAGRVVVHVLDAPSGQVFACAFDDETSLRVEPLEGDWVPAPSSDARARVARVARSLLRRELPLFEELFEEIARRRAIAQRTD
jgi:nucleotide-binding universal stress UspA family protein